MPTLAAPQGRLPAAASALLSALAALAPLTALTDLSAQPALGFSLRLHGGGGYERMIPEPAKNEGAAEDGSASEPLDLKDPAGAGFGLGVTAEPVRFGVAGLLVDFGVRGNSLSTAKEEDGTKFEYSSNVVYVGAGIGVGIHLGERFEIDVLAGYDHGVSGSATFRVTSKELEDFLGSDSLGETAKMKSASRIPLTVTALGYPLRSLGVGVGFTYLANGKEEFEETDDGATDPLKYSGYVAKATITYTLMGGTEPAAAKSIASEKDNGERAKGRQKTLKPKKIVSGVTP